MSDRLEVRVRKRLGDFELDAEFDGPANGVTALFGPSGAGKSQLLAAIAGASRPDEGRLTLGGRVLFDRREGVDIPMQQRGVGWVFQDGRLFPHLDVAANLRYGARRARGRDAGVRFDPLLDALGIAPLLGRRPATLSGGERQRVAIGRALLSQPSLLLMDEPLASLDAERRGEILPYLERLGGLVSLPILYVTHELTEVIRLADRLVLLRAGRVVAHGPLADVLARVDLAALSGRSAAAVVLDGRVRGHETARGLSRLMIGGAELLVPALALPVGARLRVAISARNVLISHEPPGDMSTPNILAGVVEALVPTGAGGGVHVRIRLKDGPELLAAATGDAVRTLSLAPGMVVFAIITAIDAAS